MKYFLSTTILFLTLNLQAQIKKAPEEIQPLLVKYTCATCHNVDKKFVGPSYQDISAKGYKPKEIIELIANPKPSNWPTFVPMVGIKNVPKKDAKLIADWIVSLSSKKD
jgi:cytochrome c